MSNSNGDASPAWMSDGVSASFAGERNTPPARGKRRPPSPPSSTSEDDADGVPIRSIEEQQRRGGSRAFQDHAGSNPAADYLTTAEAAAYLRLSKSFLDKARVYGGGPEFIRLGRRKVVYRRSDLDDWVRRQRYRSTSEYRVG